MRLVLKFGGESLGSTDKIVQAMELVRKNSHNGLVVVVSALAGVTDQLVGLSKKALLSEDPAEITEDSSLLKDMHIFEAQRLIKDDSILSEVTRDLDLIFKEVENVLSGICYINEITPRTRDRLLSMGERLSAPIISGVLRSIGLASTPLTGWDIGIVTDSTFTRANHMKDVSLRNISRVLSPLLEKSMVPVVTGFIANNEKGDITTLGRGGSDLTASLIGAALDCDEIWLCKNVDGILTADPAFVHDARLLETITYREAAEIAYFGAKIIHPLCMGPALDREIPVRVRSSVKHDIEGTLVVKNNTSKKKLVTSVSILDNIGLVNVSGMNILGTPDLVTRILKLVNDANIPILMVSQGSSEANLTFVTHSEHAMSSVELLKKNFKEGRHFRCVCLDEGKCIIAAVGAGMLANPGIAARIFSAISNEGINITMISSGSNELNISFAVDKSEAKRAVCAIHREFGLHTKEA